jgi:hypothetical protein
MATDTSVQIVREAPEIEAYKLGLLEQAKKLAEKGITLPKYQVAGFGDLQDKAFETADAGIGGYQPFLDAGGAAMTGGLGRITGAEPMLQGAARRVTGDEVSQYMNPFQEAIQAEINRGFDKSRAEAGLQAVQQGGGAAAFGSRGDLLRGEIERGRSDALARAAAENYMNAAGMAERQLERERGIADQMGIMGLRQAQLGQNIAGLGQLGTALGREEAGFLFDLGERERAQRQSGIDAVRQTQLQQLYEPYQRYGFLSDIFKGAPSSQQTLLQAASPSVSPFQQFAGLGIAGLSAAAGAQKAGLFG